jgi:hypothetical protein
LRSALWGTARVPQAHSYSLATFKEGQLDTRRSHVFIIHNWRKRRCRRRFWIETVAVASGRSHASRDTTRRGTAVAIAVEADEALLAVVTAAAMALAYAKASRKRTARECVG